MLIPDTAEVTVECTFGGNRDFNDLINVFHVRDTVGGWTGNALESIAQDVYETWRDNILPLLNSNVRLWAVEAKDAGAEDGLVRAYQPAVPDVGGVAGEAAPYQLAMLITLKGDAGSKPRRGFKYIGGFSVSDQDDQAWLPATRTAVDTAWGNVLSDINVGDRAFVIVSKYLNGAERVTAVTNTLDTYEVQGNFSSQRNRRYGIGS